MQTFQTAVAPGQGPKNYVFVDEHNRHKRLKVMRACEGCRRRKIKCDAATTNSWPCAACKRLKLTCVPPVGGIDGEVGAFDSTDSQYIPQQAPESTGPQYPTQQIVYTQDYSPHGDVNQPYTHYDPAAFNLQVQPNYPYAGVGQDGMTIHTTSHRNFAPQRYSSFDSVNGHIPAQSVGSPQSADSVTAEDLAENLGDLRIDDSGIAPYIRQQHKTEEAPAPIVDDEEDLPALETTAGSQVRIPPALMPTDEEAHHAFESFFTHVHPYVPVLCKSQFYHQWSNDRHSMSPLLLETVLACGGQVSDDPAGGAQWLALANRHEQNFADTPRLSTIQALLLLLKAREKAPRRGYYYRSWILIKKIIGMAKDLDLHEHHEIHQSGATCDSTPADCLSKTRIWQSAMVVELMVGGPQGRSDYGVDIDSVDITTAPPNSNIDEYETRISREFAYWVRNVRNIRGVTETYHKLKKKNKEWANDPKFVAYNVDFRKWPSEVPEDLRIPFPTDSTMPVITSHFLANMHCHFQLGIVMLYKPQLTASKDFAHDEKWKSIMALCYRAAKHVCILQEATLQRFDILGLSCMQRGLSFPIYAILSCVMVHLVAITSPDPSYNHDAREFFIRHMRVLEKCIAEWPMPEVEAQIHGLRAAFSTDLSRPFDLRPSFPYGSPSESSKSPGGRRASEPQHQIHTLRETVYQQPMPSTTYFPTPPVSAGAATKPATPQYYQEFGQGEANTAPFQQIPVTGPSSNIHAQEAWNPTPIIDQFNTAFAIPPSALNPPTGSSYSSSPPIAIPPQTFSAPVSQQYMPSPTSAGGYNAHAHTPSPSSQAVPPQAFGGPSSHTTPQPQMTPTHFGQPGGMNSYFEGPNHHHGSSVSNHQSFSQGQKHYPHGPETGSLRNPVYVSPREWQQSVASVFDPSGLKRKWA